MPFLNLETKLIIHSDQNIENPKVRLCDIVDTFQGVQLSSVKSQEFILKPNEQQVVANTQRVLGANIATSQFQIVRPVSTDSTVRFQWTGVGGDPAFRAARATGVDATTVMSLVRSGPMTMRLLSVSGTAMVTTTVIPGDEVFFEKNYDTYSSPFPASMTGRTFQVQSVGANYIDFIDNGTATEAASIALSATLNDFIIMSFPVNGLRAFDTIQINCLAFNSFNRGSFQITLVTPTFIEFANPYGVLETQTNTANGIWAYENLVGFVYLIASGPVSISLDGQPGITLGILGNGASFFNGSVSASVINITNNSEATIAVRSQYSSVVIGC